MDHVELERYAAVLLGSSVSWIVCVMHCDVILFRVMYKSLLNLLKDNKRRFVSPKTEIINIISPQNICFICNSKLLDIEPWDDQKFEQIKWYGENINLLMCCIVNHFSSQL